MPRIPGLPNFSSVAAGDDEVPLYDSSEDRTYGATLADLAAYFVAYIDLPDGGAGFVAPPNDGSYYVWLNTDWAVAPIQADAASDGTYYARRNAAWTAVPIQSDAASDGSYYTRRNGAWSSVPASWQASLSDRTTALEVGEALIVPWPFDMAVSEAFIGVSGASSSGSVEIDATVSGSSIFTTKPAIAASENTSLESGGTAAAFSGGSVTITKGTMVTFEITAAGTDATELTVTFNGAYA